MTRLSEIAEQWFGLCRKPPVIRTIQADFIHLPTTAHEGLPDGGGGGSGAIRRGIGVAFSGMRTLNRNRQLLWFGLLAGLVLVGNTIGQAVFWYLSYNLHMEISWIARQFFIELATMVCLVFLLAGLFLSIPSGNDKSVSFFEGLAGARKYLKAVCLWSFVLALAGMLFIMVFSYIPSRFPTPETLYLYHMGFGRLDSFLYSTLSQFPFNLSQIPPSDLFTEIPGYGGRSVLLWFYPGFRETLIFSAINVLMFILTPFVIPLIVLEQKNLRQAVAGSFGMIKKIGSEAAACAAFLAVIVCGSFLAYLLVQAAYLMVTPLATYYRPTDVWIALGLLYDLALFSIVFIVTTVGGIAALEMYRDMKAQESGQ